ncbi:cytochrome P450 [Irpex rosettiformis]|uniref:Cytochrome P450 n=1 Tax=Irpex rosettiformis TaxID=378272 RepID=A0ACB8UFC4_9APHY|nr:cytochrome P450 [Irpex rosettiformis]
MAFTTVLSATVFVAFLRRKKHTASLPPGPPAEPLIGHLRLMPNENDRDEVFYQWSRKYGDVFSLQVLGQTIIVLNSEKSANELLEKRSAQYSDRPPFPIFDRIGWKGGLLFSRYGTEEFTYQRKMCNLALQKSTIPACREFQVEEIDIMLKGLLDHPKDFDQVLHRATAGIMFASIYGLHIKSYDDVFIGIANDIARVVYESSRPSLLDVSPYFEQLPEWFPGAWFIRHIKEAAPVLHRIIHLPYDKALKAMASGEAPTSFVQQQLEAIAEGNQRDGENTRRLLRLAASQMIGGGMETTWDTLVFFIVCMMQNPDAQKQAQAEIDRVVGRDKLPEFEHRDALPYLGLHPVIPQGMPHRNMKDDYYEGMYIPEGAIILANARSLTQDEKNYHEPSLFKPSRFLPQPDGAGEKFPISAVFGWGRRICPGRHLAAANLWLAIARILSVFDIKKPIDTNCHTIDQTIRFHTGITRHPEPFLCDIVPRDEKASVLVQESYTMHEASHVA